MALDKSQLDRLAEDTYKDRLITGFIYCGTCGYNLHSLPYVYTCPECGHSYNARPLSMKGIFTPQAAHIPVTELIGTALCLPVSVALIWSGVKNSGDVRFVLGLGIGVLAVLLIYQGCRQFMRYFRYVAIARRIGAEEE